MPSKHKKRLLIVEDEKPIAKALQLKLSHSGFDVELAMNGEEALQCIEKNTFDLILLDLIMPKMNGFDFLEELKKRKNSVPVIVSSNLSQEEDMKRVKTLGAVDYYVKSNVTIAQVVEKVNRYLGA
ncbi:MAG: response regulator [Candidatus Kerfeldbacteria bacterium]|nr:response regulator [Candidatus Kerfeldbacteria bacterium]